MGLLISLLMTVCNVYYTAVDDQLVPGNLELGLLVDSTVAIPVSPASVAINHNSKMAINLKYIHSDKFSTKNLTFCV